ncbi:hypothetical protein [Spiroplasma taiwanense]|uniref:Uncharacterized protein n=1 Tax=Spiroplasma taiwanense CT-1 TaxID=1276220 RepID=S5MBW7_9MOLU|nr:hypothetical protein [Spiroplasma taiwanense]AGR41233.1 hypothetical protein STAIW_v1c06110 [Spiroplasma taiwanense CT-1]
MKFWSWGKINKFYWRFLYTGRAGLAEILEILNGLTQIPVIGISIGAVLGLSMLEIATVFNNVYHVNGLYTKMEICLCVRAKNSDFSENNF